MFLGQKRAIHVTHDLRNRNPRIKKSRGYFKRNACMRLSTPLWSAFFSHRHQQSLLPLRNIKFHPRPRYNRFIAPVGVATISAASTLASSTSHPAIDDLARKLDSLAPRFELENGDVTVLSTPEEFYITLKEKILSAKNRIFLSSLYIGKEETELVTYI